MNRFEYIKEIEKLLKNQISDTELYDIMRDYTEFFEEGKKQGKTEQEVIKSLGDPIDIAKEILGTELDIIPKVTMGEKAMGNIKRATNKVKSSTSATINSISNATKTAKEKSKLKSEQKAEDKAKYETEQKANITIEDEPLQENENSIGEIKYKFVEEKEIKLPIQKPEKTYHSINFRPFWGVFFAPIGYFTILFLLFSGAFTILFSIASVVALSVISITITKLAIAAILLPIFAILFLGIGILLSSFVLAKSYNRYYFHTATKEINLKEPTIPENIVTQRNIISLDNDILETEGEIEND